MIDAVRQANPTAQVYCSNRDIMVQKFDQAAREAKIVRILKEHFDHVLVHSDPALIPMEETFAATPDIADMIRYTGYVTDGSAPSGVSSERRRQITRLKIPKADIPESGIFTIKQNGPNGPMFVTESTRARIESTAIVGIGFYPAGRVI